MNKIGGHKYYILREITLSAKSSLILGENKAAFCREGHDHYSMEISLKHTHTAVIGTHKKTKGDIKSPFKKQSECKRCVFLNKKG